MEKDISYLLREFIVNLWELRKLKLNGKDACPDPQSDSSGWDWSELRKGTYIGMTRGVS